MLLMWDIPQLNNKPKIIFYQGYNANRELNRLNREIIRGMDAEDYKISNYGI